jgi:3-carboxy-cis,cis-muconate cycloisomerase
MTIGMFESFVTRHWFSDVAKSIWSDEATLQAWLDVEAALALAEADLGVVPADAATRIAEVCRAELFDHDELSRGIAHAQHPFVPVLKQLERLCGDPAAGYIHWGATTQNIFDSASALQMRRTHDHVDARLARVEAILSDLATAHRDTLQAGRTHGQHALPMTFGFKVLGWLEELRRNRERLSARIDESFVACLGGAIGTFAAIGELGRDVERQMAARLGLRPAGLPMRSSFDRASDYISAVGLLAGTAEKLARDVVFMQRTEIGEVEEAFHMGKIGSSTMAQKRNPSTALTLISICRLTQARVALLVGTMVRMDEGDSSATNVADIALPELGVLAASVAETLERLVDGLVVHREKMEENLQITNGLIVSEAAMMQMSHAVGRHHAHEILYEAAQRTAAEGIPFSDTIRQHPALAEGGLSEWTIDLSAASYTGSSGRLVDDLA